METWGTFYEKSKPFLAVIFIQFGYAGMSIISKFALNQGMSQHVLVVYRHAVATIVMAPFAILFDRKVRPKMTFSVFVKILLLGLLEPTIDQNLYYTGMKYTTATFASAMCNILPAFAFLMAWALRLEEVKWKKVHSWAKVLGTIVTVGGAMLMTLIKGAILELPWSKGYDNQASTAAVTPHDTIKGAFMIGIGCLCWSCFIILQAITLKTYPAELSLTALICFMGTIEGSIFAVIMEKGNPSAWSIHFDSKLLAAVYSGVMCSGIAYYVQGVIMKAKGPVFVTAFNPLSMVIVTILGSFVLSEIMYLGRIIGALVIVTGLYLVLWGKSKDKSPLASSNDKEVVTTSEMGTTGESVGTSNQEFVAIDVTKVRPTE
ncbi:WAT1-related protein At2g39510 [Jatropha curcas]|nr:WAT1-related protein At2g39510 [Jatropha curcas]